MNVFIFLIENKPIKPEQSTFRDKKERPYSSTIIKIEIEYLELIPFFLNKTEKLYRLSSVVLIYSVFLIFNFTSILDKQHSMNTYWYAMTTGDISID